MSAEPREQRSSLGPVPPGGRALGGPAGLGRASGGSESPAHLRPEPRVLPRSHNCAERPAGHRDLSTTDDCVQMNGRSTSLLDRQVDGQMDGLKCEQRGSLQTNCRFCFCAKKGGATKTCG